MTTCSIAGCDGNVKARGWCNRHYLRWSRYGDPEASPIEPWSVQALALIGPEDENGCWPWLGHINSDGYGVLNCSGLGRVPKRAHRLVYLLQVGPIPDGMTLDHTCRVRHCVNPAHLDPVDGVTNIMRGESPPARHARKETCPQGHPYDYVVPSTGRRQCRTCRRERSALRR